MQCPWTNWLHISIHLYITAEFLSEGAFEWMAKFLLLSTEAKFLCLSWILLSQEFTLVLVNRKRHNQAGVRDSDQTPWVWGRAKVFRDMKSGQLPPKLEAASNSVIGLGHALTLVAQRAHSSHQHERYWPSSATIMGPQRTVTPPLRVKLLELHKGGQHSLVVPTD